MTMLVASVAAMRLEAVAEAEDERLLGLARLTAVAAAAAPAAVASPEQQHAFAADYADFENAGAGAATP
jgi:hypothetical protein